MNPFLFSIVALCLAQSGLAIAQYNSGSHYQSASGSYGQQQRKMAPSPQTYGQAQQAAGGYSMGSYGQAAEQQSSYGGHEMSAYEQPAGGYQAAQSSSHRAPSSASVSSYDERTPSSYGKQQSYAPARQQGGYAAPAAAAASYAKPAQKYEEPSHPPMPFAWGYDINDGYGGAQYHKETGDEYGKRTGSYGYTDAYGVYRQVDYVADEHGFRATIKTNEPGTANESPADVELHAYEPPSNHYAGSQSYGGQQQQQSGYGKQQQSYGASKQQSSYAARPAPSSYGKQQQQNSAYGASRMGGYQEQQSYSSSAIVPTYVKAAVAPVAAKKY